MAKSSDAVQDGEEVQAMQFPPRSQRKKAVQHMERRDLQAAIKAKTGEEDLFAVHKRTIEAQHKAAKEERVRNMSHDELIRDAAQFHGDMTEEESYQLLERNARGEPMRFVEVPKNSKLRPPLFHYKLLFPHPLTSTTDADLLANNKTMRKIQHLEASQRAWHAVIDNKPWCLEELYLQGYPLDIPDASGMTPLHLAAHFGHFQCVQVLLNSQAVNINAQTICGVTPLESAVAAGHPQVEALLRQASAQFAQHSKPLSGYRSILDVAGDYCQPPKSQITTSSFPTTVAQEISQDLQRPPYYLQY